MLPQFHSARLVTVALVGAGTLVPACGTAHDAALAGQRELERERELFGPAGARAYAGAAAVGEQAVWTSQSTADDYVRHGLLRNPSLRAAFENWRAALARLGQVSELPDPRFTYSHFVEEVQTRTGPQRHRFGLSQSLPWPGKLGARGDAAAAHAESLWWRVDAQRRIQTGAGQQELLQLQVEIGRLEDALASLRRYRPALNSRLSALLDRPRWSLLPFPELGEPPPDETAPSLEAADGAFQEGNPELKELAERIRVEAANRALAGLEGWPDLTLGVEYVETGAALGPGTAGSGDDPWALTIGFNLPLWRGRYAPSSDHCVNWASTKMSRHTRPRSAP